MEKSKGWNKYLSNSANLRMGLSSSQKEAQNRANRRYRSKLARVGGVTMSRSEADWLAKRKRELGLTWREVLYRGMGLARVDYLESERQKRKAA